MLSQSIPAPSSRLSALSNRGVVYAVLALGLAGLLIELVSAVFVPRLVLYLAVLVFGGVGLVRCRRAAPRRCGLTFTLTRITTWDLHGDP